MKKFKIKYNINIKKKSIINYYKLFMKYLLNQSILLCKIIICFNLINLKFFSSIPKIHQKKFAHLNLYQKNLSFHQY